MVDQLKEGPLQERGAAALKRAYDLALRNIEDARVPECGNFASIAQDLLCALQALKEAQSSLDFYKRRCDLLQAWQSKMRDPERTIVCDILANGQTLDEAVAGDRYTANSSVSSEAPVDENPSAAPWPESAAQVRRFIGLNFSALKHGTENGEPHEDDVYQVSAHDLLSAFRDWEAEPNEAAVLLQHVLAERDEADRRAGAAERECAKYREDAIRIDRVRNAMKDQWGVGRNVSFDQVWAEALALKASSGKSGGEA